MQTHLEMVRNTRTLQPYLAEVTKEGLIWSYVSQDAVAHCA